MKLSGWRLGLSLALGVVVVQGLLVGYLANRARASGLESLLSSLATTADLLAQTRHSELLAALAGSRAQGLSDLTPGPGQQLSLLDAEGRLVREAAKDSQVMQDPSPAPELDAARTSSLGKALRYSAVEGRELLFVAVALRNENQLVGFVRVSASPAPVDQALGQLVVVFLGVTSLLFLGIGAIALTVGRRFDSRLEALSAGASQFAQGQRPAALFLTRPASLRQLSLNLNSLYDRVDARLSQLGDEKNELMAILAGMVEAVVVLDAHLVVKTMNPSARRLFPGTRVPEGLSLIEAVRNSALDDLARDLLKGPEDQRRTELPLAERQITLQVQGAALRSSTGTTWGLVLVMSDITQLKRLEIMRRDFVANVSHELKTPLTTIRGYVETLREGALADPERAETFLSVIERQADRLALIVDDLLILTRLENSPPEEGELRSVDLDELVETVLASFADRAKKLRLKLVHQRSEVLAVLPVFPLLLEQALGNLLDNSLKFCSAGAVVTVTVSSERGECQVEVRDNGPGIAEGDQQRVFERFYRTEASRTIDGTGLGLALVKHIVLLHHGTVTLSSPPPGRRKGTSFLLSFAQADPAGR